MRKRYILGVVILLLAGLAGLELTGVTHIFIKKKPPAVSSGSSFSSKGEKKASSGQAATQPSSGGTGSSYNSTKVGGSTANLLAPTGNFVSNHHPSLSGSSAPYTEASVCDTTPGASCAISFTKDGVTKSLPTQTADPTGFTNWNWKLQDIGLTAGTWKIQATASLNGQTKSASDAMDLVVSP